MLLGHSVHNFSRAAAKAIGKEDLAIAGLFFILLKHPEPRSDSFTPTQT
jgi:hypothetical protein